MLSLRLFCYYLSYAKSKNTIPLRKKTFSALLKTTLAENEECKTILFDYRKHPRVVGVRLVLKEKTNGKVDFESTDIVALTEYASTCSRM